MVLVVKFFVSFFIVAAICDQVHDAETMHDLCKLLTSSANLV